MSSTHKHKNCGGEIWSQATEDGLKCDKCGRFWTTTYFQAIPLHIWESIFEGYHPTREAINNEEVLVEVQVGQKAFLSLRKRGLLGKDGRIAGEDGVWRTAKL